MKGRVGCIKSGGDRRPRRYFCRNIVLILGMAMWETPVYRFRVPSDGSEESENAKEIIIDVTDSAPSFKKPSSSLKEVLTRVFSSHDIETVLEFGAGKLKNIPFLLEQGKSVCAVEFQELSTNPFVKKNLTKCRKYGARFQELVFPNPFLTDSRSFDLVLLANVMPVMPIPSERLFLLDMLHGKINPKKFLLWVAQKEGSYKPIREAGKNDFGDGLWMGKGKCLKTFYKYHRMDELDELMGLYGFEPVIRSFGVTDDARLYQKIDYNLFSNLLSANRIRGEIPVDETIANPSSTEFKEVERSRKTKLVLPNPRSLSIENLYVERILNTPVNAKNAEVYHRLVSHAICRIFRGSLRNMVIKQRVEKGVGIIDTVFTNSADKGFFKTLQNLFSCLYLVVEAKNIKDDPGNDDFSQVNARLGNNVGDFGILVCRKIEDIDGAVKKCKVYRQQNHAIMFLTDSDLVEMLALSRDQNYDEIDDMMDRRLKEILF